MFTANQFAYISKSTNIFSSSPLTLTHQKYLSLFSHMRVIQKVSSDGLLRKKQENITNPINQQLPNIVSIMTTSSHYRILNSSPQKLTTWIVSSEKPLK